VRIGSSRQERGFAIIAAIGVLAILMILGFGAAVVTQFTYGFSRARVADREYSDVLREGAQLLATRSVPEPGSPTFEVWKHEGSGKNDVQVSATVQLAEVGTKLLGAALKPREGDRVVELTASAPSGKVRRSSFYLINVSGARTAPILLLERRQ
jgi:hypothetical protein